MYTEISMVGPTVVNTDLPSQIDSDNREIRTDIKLGVDIFVNI